MTRQHDFQAFNRLAETCSNHRMVMTSSESVPMNPRYDNGTNEPENIKEDRYTHKCSGSCQQSITYTFKNQ